MKKNFKYIIYMLSTCLILSTHSKVAAMSVYDINDNINIEQDLSKNYNSEKPWNTLSNLEIAIESHMINRDTSFTIKYAGEFKNLHKDIENVLNSFKINDSYLFYSYSFMKWTISGTDENIIVNFEVKYFTTKTQEDIVDKKINEILKDLKTSSMSEDEKAKVIHDYIVNNVSYDKTLSKNTAYDALFNKSSVCQGYALLAYKMLNAAGIETNIIEGTAGGGAHVWNMVKIRNKWYHIDCTWNYFKLIDTEISKDHNWNKNLYPASYYDNT